MIEMGVFAPFVSLPVTTDDWEKFPPKRFPILGKPPEDWGGWKFIAFLFYTESSISYSPNSDSVYFLEFEIG